MTITLTHNLHIFILKRFIFQRRNFTPQFFSPTKSKLLYSQKKNSTVVPISLPEPKPVSNQHYSQTVANRTITSKLYFQTVYLHCQKDSRCTCSAIKRAAERDPIGFPTRGQQSDVTQPAAGLSISVKAKIDKCNIAPAARAIIVARARIYAREYSARRAGISTHSLSRRPFVWFTRKCTRNAGHCSACGWRATLCICARARRLAGASERNISDEWTIIW